MAYTVQPGDSLWSISARQLGTPSRWPEIARINVLRNSARLFVGEQLVLPRTPFTPYRVQPGSPPLGSSNASRPAVLAIRTHVFIIADEMDPFRRKLVRKVIIPKRPMSAAEIERIMKPDRYGFTPRDPSTNVSIGRHVGQNMTNSRYMSASERPLGSPRFEGNRYWIDAAQAEAAGVTIHEADAIAKDLDRVMGKTKDPRLLAELDRIKKLSAGTDREVLLEGAVPASAIKGAGAMAVTRGFQVVAGVGLALTAYDLAKAGQQSRREHSVVPLASEAGRQAGGWAGAWAGAEIGGALGAALGIETGPGAIVTGAVGSLIFGTAGFLGADWAVHKLGGR